MNYPRTSGDPFADADARDRWEQAQRDGHKKIRCTRCHHYVEEGDEYIKFDGNVLCEYCIHEITNVMVY